MSDFSHLNELRMCQSTQKISRHCSPLGHASEAPGMKASPA
uniref:Uncharacterized protein n=1 Tax=Anguilla anguilla TaxID=7936 RepID=A0A0E9WFZ0_ANGAN